MQFQTLLAILPTLISLTTAIPVEAAVQNTEDADKVCFFSACVGKSNGQAKCKFDQCIEASAPTASTCFKAAHKPKSDMYDKIQCASVIMNMGGNSPPPCKDCVGQLAKLIASI
ncbi:hypothetical protein EG328_004231 [Venturia inaequalis]|uniref:Uncharacterized protein n=1 Tax=Venturia inaequalis TaxID=5025 RepID=A0A8H3UQG8_VENIN|nr:hypothetical protein EG328_004231 [Venturia inaequalis]KAE9980220.1 hypothetical protein EG327_006666 [Venturia inaequalis]RDI81179.1 hypothetical protein Vi05172_g8849 [Venturia inaequalis]